MKIYKDLAVKKSPDVDIFLEVVFSFHFVILFYKHSARVEIAELVTYIAWVG